MDDVGRDPQVVQVDDLGGAQGKGFPDIDDVFADHPFIQSTAGQLHHVGYWARPVSYTHLTLPTKRIV